MTSSLRDWSGRTTPPVIIASTLSEAFTMKTSRAFCSCLGSTADQVPSPLEEAATLPRKVSLPVCPDPSTPRKRRTSTVVMAVSSPSAPGVSDLVSGVDCEASNLKVTSRPSEKSPPVSIVFSPLSPYSRLSRIQPAKSISKDAPRITRAGFLISFILLYLCLIISFNQDRLCSGHRLCYSR